MTAMPNWADHLRLRDEVVASDGSVGDLQISLGKAVYQTEDVPYRELSYWCEITEPTDLMIGTFAKVARRLWATTLDSTALIQFDQGMGGGKSHALVGMWHMARQPSDFFSTDIGRQVRIQAETGDRVIEPSEVRIVALCADRFSPGHASDLYGPAQNLFERFLWSLFSEDRERYDHYRSQGANKQTLGDALREVGKPILILLDELMDYVAAATAADYIERLPDEREFLNSLFDACDDLPKVVFMLVMIRSDIDQYGYSPAAGDFRAFLQSKIERNGISVRVTESKDFINIIRRRIFTASVQQDVVDQVAVSLRADIEGTLWQEKAFDQLPAGRNLTSVIDQVAAYYPFHPELVALVQSEWSSTVGFQRVRSTVRVFSATVLHWTREHQNDNWVPPLIGIGDLPLDDSGVLDNILNSGLLLNLPTHISGFANLASTDITSFDGISGRAVDLDRMVTEDGVDAAQPRPAVRMGTALFSLSLVDRDRGAKGATKPELLASIWQPGLDYTVAEEVFHRLVDLETGLGSLESTDPGNGRNRYWLSIKRTLTAIQRAARSQISSDGAEEAAWAEAKRIAIRHIGHFDRTIAVDRPDAPDLSEIIAGIVERSTRLIVLDPRRWTLSNGTHDATKRDVEELLGAGSSAVSFYASAVIAVANTNNRRFMYERARDVLAWRHVVRQLGESDPETMRQAKERLAESVRQLEEKVALAFRHYVYTAAGDPGGHTVELRRFESDARTSLRGDHIWTALVSDGRAIERNMLNAEALEIYLKRYDRSLTPKEVVDSFYDNPRHLLVADEADVTSAWDSLIGIRPNPRGGWHLVNQNGEPFSFTGPGQIAKNRMDARFEPFQPEIEGPDDGDGGDDEDDEEPVGDGNGDNDGHTTDHVYRDYKISLPNTSLGSSEQQAKVWKLLSDLVAKLDPVDRRTHGDQQVVSFRIDWLKAESDFDDLRRIVEDLGGSLQDEEPLA